MWIKEVGLRQTTYLLAILQQKGLILSVFHQWNVRHGEQLSVASMKSCGKPYDLTTDV